MAYQDFDYYEALGVDSSASRLEIRKAYHKISKIYHPDKALSFDEQQQYKALREAKEKDTELSQLEKNLLNKLEKKIEPFSKAAIAYETLCDPDKRKKYNKYKGIKNSYQPEKSYQPKTNTKKDIESDLIEALHHKDLKKVKSLIKELNDLCRLEIISSMSFLFVENACSDDNWFTFFEEILSSKQINFRYNYYFYNTAFQHAFNANNRKVVELLLKNSVYNINKTYSFTQEETVPIYHALKHNNHDLVSLFFQYGATIHVSDEIEQKIIATSHLYNKQTMEILLQYTSPEQNTKIVRNLIKNESKMDACTEILALFVDKGIDLFDIRLSEAFSDQNLEKAQNLIKDIKNSSTCFTKNPENFGLLVEMACKNNDWFKFFKEVLSDKRIKIDLDVSIKRCRGTALQYACRLKKKDVAELLLDNGAGVNKVVSGRTAIFFATIKCTNSEEVELVRLLLNRGADPYLGQVNIRYLNHENEDLKELLNQDYKSRLSEAFKRGNLEIVKNLGRQIYLSNALLAQEHLYYFVKNSCDNDDWFNYFQDLINSKCVKINLDVDISSRALNYAVFHKNGRKVVELLIRRNTGNKIYNSDNISDFITARRSAKTTQSPPTEETGPNLIDNSSKSLVCEQNTKQVPINPTSTIKDSGLTGCNSIPYSSEEKALLNTSASNNKQDVQSEVLLSESKSEDDKSDITVILADTKKEKQAPTQPDEQANSIARESTQPKPVTNEQDISAKDNSKSKPKENNVTSQNKNIYIVATSALALSGIVSGIVIAVYSGMLAIGIAVGVCCLITAAVMYYCNSPSNLLKDSNTEVAMNQGQEL
ncbi:ankyrin repeat domain-containing protein [Wolbachia endosymbiont of Diaphorina citri]|jgi:DnaJ-class molecular chaperone with C-terminal Zn finger domain|uniref:TomO hydrophobic C-terminal domain-containing protein n=1 Tax=Wolbachia endosymbiont of Diaphorina citri TaxID=116598 RepID=UPI00155E4549|nr:ankyrin repeat domain-containing protein [Wolbachia endosymbiont of Diaphorina citri]QJT94920.1 ankyrin repeat domain-containing protein [Wolbachia endosymbiont of Diaphorina citri]QJT96021.1 ankyrin repeat domain-containing protein [Wolbachia endosymbiont of Diaphorina citri]QJT97383.1 ankyrin repeat domain-containing protein [Wolbachia endosymbiont of Diaphorina citri]QLK11867.1 DnaJ domain-containing protein [Wolbachia endosymbiont of Diaphorina citri]QXY86788.1 DnaJ domain-containing pr